EPGGRLLAGFVVVTVRRLAESGEPAVADLEDEPVALQAQALVPAVRIRNRAKAQRQRTLRADDPWRRDERARGDDRRALPQECAPGPVSCSRAHAGSRA